MCSGWPCVCHLCPCAIAPAWCTVIIARDRGPFLVAQIILALFIGYAVAAFVTADGKRYVATTEINNAVGGTFLWVRCPRKPALDLKMQVIVLLSNQEPTTRHSTE